MPGLNQKDYFNAYLKFSKIIWQYVHSRTHTYRLSDDIVQKILIDLWRIRDQVELENVLETLYTIADQHLESYHDSLLLPKT